MKLWNHNISKLMLVTLNPFQELCNIQGLVLLLVYVKIIIITEVRCLLKLNLWKVNLRMAHSMLGLPLYPAGHWHRGWWLTARQIAVGAQASSHGSIQRRLRRSQARLVGQSWLYWQPWAGGLTVVQQMEKKYIRMRTITKTVYALATHKQH